MTGHEAELYLSDYRALLKTWTMAMAGFSDHDCDTLCARLEAGRQQLAEIARAHPEKSYSVDMLINARSRTWGGFTTEPLPQLAKRQPGPR